MTTTPLLLTPGRRADDTPVLKAAGEIDMSNADALASALDALPGRIVVDLTAVEYLDSAALSVLFARHERIELLTSPLIAPVLAVSGLADLTTVRETDG
ncbi:STAS domain-containing protein [Streptomyces omiyaensis]|uniref:STAS domain-containing protein n=1 Tax=Streptomyces omiyaensis TaxID=68247 RepID=A0ABW7BX63_9ACTN|nr:STAS domain-containing protein [Streptomyces omiyaensis]GGY62356.1 hypothetical protein GCM10010363_49830 [Streptomyces omiyaensis]